MIDLPFYGRRTGKLSGKIKDDVIAKVKTLMKEFECRYALVHFWI